MKRDNILSSSSAGGGRKSWYYLRLLIEIHQEKGGAAVVVSFCAFNALWKFIITETDDKAKLMRSVHLNK